MKVMYSEDAPIAQTDGSAGYDLVTARNINLKPHDYQAVETKTSLMGFDKSHVALLFARSSLMKNHKVMLANGVGVIDSDYKDRVHVLLYNPTGYSCSIPAGTRIAQLVFVPVKNVEFTHIADNKIAEARKETLRIGGTGSTGKE